jgi:hypothetical protein
LKYYEISFWLLVRDYSLSAAFLWFSVRAVNIAYCLFGKVGCVIWVN